MEIRLLITEDHTLLRATWCQLFKADPRFIVIGDCGSGEEAIDLATKLEPDIIIMDINLPGINGIEATKKILSLRPRIRVLGVSMHKEPHLVNRMMDSGAKGYVTKSSPLEEIFKALLEIYDDRVYICSE